MKGMKPSAKMRNDAIENIESIDRRGGSKGNEDQFTIVVSASRRRTNIIMKAALVKNGTRTKPVVFYIIRAFIKYLKATQKEIS